MKPFRTAYELYQSTEFRKLRQALMQERTSSNEYTDTIAKEELAGAGGHSHTYGVGNKGDHGYGGSADCNEGSAVYWPNTSWVGDHTHGISSQGGENHTTTCPRILLSTCGNVRLEEGVGHEGRSDKWLFIGASIR